MSADVFERLRAAISAGELRPHQKLVEQHLARQLGVSRTPIREALQRLAAEGYVSTLPTGGVIVVDHLPEEIRAIYEIRQALEGAATRLAAERATPDDLAKIEHIQEQLRTAFERGEVDEMVDLNDAFHNAIYAAGKNAWLHQLIMTYRDFFFNRRMARVFHSTDWESALDDHERMLEDLRARDARGAEEKMRSHLATTLRVALGRL
jgi:DNA-binding GntR family transcriptional regulator